MEDDTKVETCEIRKKKYPLLLFLLELRTSLIIQKELKFCFSSTTIVFAPDQMIVGKK